MHFKSEDYEDEIQAKVMGWVPKKLKKTGKFKFIMTNLAAIIFFTYFVKHLGRFYRVLITGHALMYVIK